MHSFEQGPIRPPSEARSLLLRVTRNCPWNKCAFCTSYRGARFSLRSVAEVKADIDCMKRVADDIINLSLRLGAGGRVNDAVVEQIYHSEQFDDSHRSLVAWLYFGASSVFLQDANSLIVKTEELVEILSYMKQTFPSISRITSYCRSHTAARKSLEELVSLRDAGLSRIHVGIESGYDPVLEFIKKGSNAAEHAKGGKNIVEAGISLCAYIMPGLGGKKWTEEHALATARVINEINPAFVRLRSLHIVQGTPLYEALRAGEMEPLNDEEVVAEIKLFLENLEGISTTIVSDHILNLLEEVEGTLPQDKEKMLAVIERFSSLPLRERVMFQLGRRRGIYRKLDDLQEPTSRALIGEAADRIIAENPHDFHEGIRRLKHGFV